MPHAALVLPALALLSAAPITGAPAKAPAPPPVPPEVRAVADRMHGIRTLRVTMRQEKEMQVFGEVVRSTGTLTIARPRRLAMDLEGPGGTRLVIDGDRMGIHYKALGRTERMSLSQDPRAKAVADHLFLFLDLDPEALDETYLLEVRSVRPVVVHLTPRPDALRRIIARVEIRFDDRGFVDELLLVEGNGDRTRWMFDDPVVDQPVDPAAFTLGP